jgi:hypothetical protein
MKREIHSHPAMVENDPHDAIEASGDVKYPKLDLPPVG